MKSIKKFAGAVMALALAFGMMGCALDSDSNDPVLPIAKKTVATPTFSVESGAVDSGTSVTISCATDGATIHYTTDGSEPTVESSTYSEAISVTAAMTIKAIAVKSGMNNSAVASASYSIKHIVPECKLVSGSDITGAAYTDNYSGVFPVGRNVRLSSFYMGKYEVTQAQYKSVMAGQKVTVGGTDYTLADSPSYCTGSNESYKIDFGKDHANHPVENVTWFDAVYYCNALSAKENLDPCYTITVTTVSSGHITEATVEYDKTKNGYRLPTEAEWEYAARGGDPNADDWNYTFSGVDKAAGSSYSDKKNTGLDSVGWYCYNNITGTTGDDDVTESAEGCGTHKVGSKVNGANRLGIYDMSGNVWEWCWDWHNSSATSNDSAYTQNDKVVDPVGAASGFYRVYRGGGWCNNARYASVSYRSDNSPNNRDNGLGFRVCRSSSN